MAGLTTYTYLARNSSSGKKVRGQIQAENKASASKLLIQQGLAPLEITAGTSRSITDIVGDIFSKIKTKDKVLFSRQLSTLIGAGLPLLQSLQTTLGQTRNPNMKEVISSIISSVEGGTSLAGALEKYPNVFDQVFRSLIAAGEASGTLDASLERLATQQEKDAEIMAKVRGAMVYPIIVVIVMIAVVSFMLVAVLPQVKVLYDGFPKAKLPPLTVGMLALSAFVQKFWWLAIIIVGASGFGMRKWAKTTKGKRQFDKLRMRLPPVNRLYMKLYMARFARTSATLFASGVPMIQVLEITAKSVNNVYIEDSLKRAIEKVKGGMPLSEAIENDPNFLYLVPNMLRIGEQSGQIEPMLARTADFYEKEVDNEVKAISTIIEPAMIISLGIAALLIVGAVLLPIYGLASQT